ncbi:MAG TPA: NUDIX domain-containing protein [Puia sp.]|nr:NUDIX domain-containing protein [Puia sp.]
MKKTSAGILLFRKNKQEREFFLVHFGGPFWKNKLEGAWSIPKGECEKEESFLETALREFKEETGFTPGGDFIPLLPITQKSGKSVYAWALAMDADPEKISSNMVTITLASKKQIHFPEIDKAAWFTKSTAKKLIISAQFAFIEELENILSAES